ncbi:NADH-quinone oxidoreductase subunit B family protein [Pengzhenrongella frigida]|uniref:Oxidoreductase n=1 Tax=Pengzhenrongella frigida TaxID=1259133 RepID=A0A4Q5MYP0_9MICO|nr:oxidoreductase [Cellulomonas sp. HLT2-17]RYV50815.1 oxidoreductase [Cellulomonas sp. HLT2-17]
MTWIGKIRRVGRIVEPAPAAPEPTVAPPTGVRGSLQLRHVDAGSCNGCELELAGAFSPVYDAEQYGARLIASPRHADGLIVTGVVTHNMHEPLLNTLAAVPEPRVVIAVGDCACNRGVFATAYGVVGSVADVIDVDVQVPGCPPTPDQIVTALRSVTGK